MKTMLTSMDTGSSCRYEFLLSSMMITTPSNTHAKVRHHAKLRHSCKAPRSRNPSIVTVQIKLGASAYSKMKPSATFFFELPSEPAETVSLKRTKNKEVQNRVYCSKLMKKTRLDREQGKATDARPDSRGKKEFCLSKKNPSIVTVQIKLGANAYSIMKPSHWKMLSRTSTCASGGRFAKKDKKLDDQQPPSELEAPA
ncbi:hypothetical protein B9Z55_026537 [Caenorhabditis nigoni]|uniref:Uncharacterized protein n=2 Tax=Caenorhabditis nigoni TaxID=1611254 RepID=A0A2G5T449_9PELO|nr:hypothetical protein B9Z55_026537 [Caenorhabditis nigoni]